MNANLAAVLLSGIFAAATAGGQDASIRCDRCHADAEFLAGKRATPDQDAALFVPDSLLHASRHTTLACADCHVAYDDAYPHQPQATTIACESCHETEGADWYASIHASEEAAEDAPTCVRCHGMHSVLGAEDRESPTHPFQEVELCGGCHRDPDLLETYFADPADSVARSAVDLYHETVHGLALTKAGLVVSATCSDCHGAHRILPSEDPGSTVHHDRVTTTCGKCHVGVLESYQESSHGRALAAGPRDDDREAPVCTSCHDAHGVAPPDEIWQASVVDECGACHERLYETYFETYHGKVTRLGSTLAAKCSDCHTAHANLPADDPASTVHPANVVQTCRTCHAEASAGFAEYRPHGDPRDRERYPYLFWPWLLMSSLLAGVFLFFGTHSVLWLARGVLDLRSKDDEPEEANEDEEDPS